MNNMFTQLMDSTYMELAGWSLILSLWQGLLIALVVYFILWASKGYLSSNFRYMIALSGQIMIPVLTLITFLKGISYENFKEDSSNNVLMLFNSQTALNLSGKVSMAESILATIEVYLPFFMIAWILGLSVFLIRITGGLFYLGRVRNTAFDVGEELMGQSIDLAKRMGLKAKFRLAQSTLIHIPVAAGHFKPLVLLPLGITSDLSLSEIRAILAHELAHIKRYDYLMNIVQSFIESFFFFNPFVWWISAMVREEREYACDDLAVSCLGQRRNYAEALLKIKERGHLVNPLLSPGISGHMKKSLIERIRRIMNEEMKSKPVDWLPALVLTFVLLIPAIMVASESHKTESLKPVNLAIAGQGYSLQFPDHEGVRIIPAMLVADTIPGMEDRKTETDVEDHPGIDFNFDSDLKFDFEVAPNPDLFFDMDFDFGDLPMVPDLNIVIPPFPQIFLDNMDTIPGNWNTEEWKAELEKWQLEMEDWQQEMMGHQEEFHKKLQHKMQEWESLHRKDLEEMSHLNMEEIEKMQKEFRQQFEEGGFQEKFEEQMKELQERMESMPELKDHLQEMEFKLQMKMGHLKEFEKEMKAQLIEDGYIESGEEVKIEFGKDELRVNGKMIKKKDFPKYNELRERYFPGEGKLNYNVN